ncbi:hypothetical protein FRC12_022739, partial [Ceratobasidium sp. 428]
CIRRRQDRQGVWGNRERRRRRRASPDEAPGPNQPSELTPKERSGEGGEAERERKWTELTDAAREKAGADQGGTRGREDRPAATGSSAGAQRRQTERARMSADPELDGLGIVYLQWEASGHRRFTFLNILSGMPAEGTRLCTWCGASSPLYEGVACGPYVDAAAEHVSVAG